jgi:hypothetical protein
MEHHKHKFSKKDGGPIDQGEAKRWIDTYKKYHKGEVHAYYFGEDIIRKIIDQDEAEGMRVYLGYSDEGNLQMVLIGTRADGSNIWPTEGKDGWQGTVGDQGYPSPPY